MLELIMKILIPTNLDLGRIIILVPILILFIVVYINDMITIYFRKK